MTPTNVPKEISHVMVQITQSIQNTIPGVNVKRNEVQKIVITFTAEELEVFQLKPYPNQIYEVTISNGLLSFKKI
jgi:hypothetical protein